MNYYSKILNWCNIFLNNMSFTNFYGKEISLALLFPMEQLFESYFANIMSKSLSYENIYIQKNIGSLLSNGFYKMRPDLIIENSDSTFIFDTKWKIVDDRISQTDLYQMFAYGTKDDRNIANTQKIFLVYPQNNKFTNLKRSFFYNFQDKKLELNLFPFDLINEEKSISNIKKELI